MIKIKLLLLLIGLQNIYFSMEHRDTTFNDLSNAKNTKIHQVSTSLYIMSYIDNDMNENYITYNENPEKNYEKNTEYILQIIEYCLKNNIQDIKICPELEYFRQLLEEHLSKEKDKKISIEYIGVKLTPISDDVIEISIDNNNQIITKKLSECLAFNFAKDVKYANNFISNYIKYSKETNPLTPKELESALNEIEKLYRHIKHCYITIYKTIHMNQFENIFPEYNILSKPIKTAVTIYNNCLQGIIESYESILNKITIFQNTENKEYLKNKQYLIESQKNIDELITKIGIKYNDRNTLIENKINEILRFITRQNEDEFIIYNPIIYIKNLIIDIKNLLNENIFLYKQHKQIYEEDEEDEEKKINPILKNLFKEDILNKLSMIPFLNILSNMSRILHQNKILNEKKLLKKEEIMSLNQEKNSIMWKIRKEFNESEELKQIDLGEDLRELFKT